jgi:hypothetical protein
MPENTEETAGNEKQAVSFDLSAEVAEKVKLKDVRILAVEAKWNPTETEFPLEVSYNISTDGMVDEEGFRIAAQFRMAAKGAGDSGSGEVKVEATFDLQYEHPDAEDLTDEAIESFGALNGVYNAWPYWRELLQNMTCRMGLPPLTAPVFRLTDIDQEGVNAVEEKSPR